MEKNLDISWNLYLLQWSISCLCLVYVLSLSCLWLVYVLYISCLCLVYFLFLSIYLVYVLFMSCLCLGYVLSMSCICLVYVLSMSCLCLPNSKIIYYSYNSVNICQLSTLSKNNNQFDFSWGKKVDLCIFTFLVEMKR